jgi:hypothetical protein
MNTPARSPRSIRDLWVAFATPLLLAAALALTGCATRQQVAEIITQSNATMLGAQFELPAPSGPGEAPRWKQESDRIDAFITAHPNQKATTAPLRVRQAMLLLSYHQIGLAQAAFNQVQMGDLHTDRDQALKRSERTLVWWFGHSTNALWVDSDFSEAKAALKQLEAAQAQLAASPEIRDYLAELRAWIGLSVAKHRTSPAAVREAIADALDVYAGIFTTTDLAMLAAGMERLPDPSALAPDVRRRLRAKAVLDEAKLLNAQLKQAGETTAQARTPQFNQWINP